jgi:FkbM family methyltransferase
MTFPNASCLRTEPMSERLKMQIRKGLYSLAHPSCWHGLSLGVAPAIEHIDVLRALSVDGIIDVGANRGQFSLACKLCHPLVPIVALEPIPSEAAIFRRVLCSKKGVDLLEMAAGEECAESLLHLSNRADSSSMLPIGERQARLYPGTDEIGSISVNVQRLDALSDHWKGRRRQLLKIDVQGFELSVLKGAKETLISCTHVYAECSEIQLYDGQALRQEVESFLQGAGFTENVQHNPSYSGDQLVQADYLFSRPGPS